MGSSRSGGGHDRRSPLRGCGGADRPAHGWRFGEAGRLLLLLVAALGLLARPAAAQTEVVEYYGHDALGSVRIVFTASGVATARADYEPFGEGVTIAGMPAGPLPAQQFTGQERDALERQDYFGARYYRPRHGRFSQVDPVYAGLFDPQQWNRYAYARNNPLGFVDPDGRDPTSCFDFAGAVRCVGETTRVTAPPTGSTAQPRDLAAVIAEALAGMNNSCHGEGNSRACGFQQWERERGEPKGQAERLLVTLSFAGGFLLGAGEAGLVLAIDFDTATVDEYIYVGGGIGTLNPLPIPVSANVNVEVGLLQSGVDLAGAGWQASGYVSAILQGVTGNFMGSGFPTWPPHAGSVGWSAGLPGLGASAIGTYTWHLGQFNLGAWTTPPPPNPQPRIP